MIERSNRCLDNIRYESISIYELCEIIIMESENINHTFVIDQTPCYIYMKWKDQITLV